MKTFFFTLFLFAFSVQTFALNCKLEVKDKTVDLKLIKTSKMSRLYSAELSPFAAAYNYDAGNNVEIIALAHADGPNTNSEYIINSTWRMKVALNANQTDSATVVCYNETRR